MKPVKTTGRKERYIGQWRTRWEPIKPDSGFPKVDYCYLRTVDGPHPWMCYCSARYHWLLLQLAKQGVDIKELMPPSKEVSKAKCKEIAKALGNVVEKDDNYPPTLDSMDIPFFAHCGGIRIHPWEGE